MKKMYILVRGTGKWRKDVENGDSLICRYKYVDINISSQLAWNNNDSKP